MLSILNFSPFEEGARRGDIHWLYASSICLLDGVSPYTPVGFDECWAAAYRHWSPGPMVFGPTILPLITPLSLLDINAAKQVLDLANIAAILWLGWLIWRIAAPEEVEGPRRLARGFWAALGVSLGGVSGAASVGQPVVFVALGLALMVYGRRKGSSAGFGLGALLALIKPHIAFLALLTLWLPRPRDDLAGKLIALGLFAVIAAWAATLQGSLVSDFAASLRIHAEGGKSLLEAPQALYGLPGVTERVVGASAFWPGVLIALAAFAGLAVLVRRGAEDAALIAAIVAGPLLFPIKGYDFAVVAVAFALMGRLPLQAQAAALAAAVVLWRPAVLDIAGVGGPFVVTLIGWGLAALIALSALQKR